MLFVGAFDNFLSMAEVAIVASTSAGAGVQGVIATGSFQDKRGVGEACASIEQDSELMVARFDSP